MVMLKIILFSSKLATQLNTNTALQIIKEAKMSNLLKEKLLKFLQFFIL